MPRVAIVSGDERLSHSAAKHFLLFLAKLVR
jgi:hypothetical protein